MPTRRHTMGIDPGLSCTGFAILDDKSRLIFWTTMRSTTKDGDETQRGTVIAQTARSLAKQYEVSVVGLEWQHVSGIKGNQILKLAALRGAIAALLTDAGCRVLEVRPKEAKKRLTGDGNADKKYMQEWVKQRHRCSVPQDAADAVGVAHHAQEIARLETTQPALIEG